ncbi:MAG: 6-phosphofructokinase [Candidatus Eisenbacteria bacterium]|nr:6-phosphofructokinase [Candidatus Eisenbacteria bacterium]
MPKRKKKSTRPKLKKAIGNSPLPPGVVRRGQTRTPQRKGDHIRRVGMIFAGGPAPAANAVISSAAISLLDDEREVIGFLRGYQSLQEYHPVSRRLQEGRHYRLLTAHDVTGIRNMPGILLGTSRANPGSEIRGPADLRDKTRAKKLHNVYAALADLELDALISIGGDDTLKTANLLFEYQKTLPRDARRIHIVHLPKTIDNDYDGIDFTFGYFTAVDFLAKEMKNLRADAEAADHWFIAQAMGRKAGWLSYGVGIAGEANLVFTVEDVEEEMLVREEYTTAGGQKRTAMRLQVEALVDRIVDLMVFREEKEQKSFGTVVLAEGLAELLPQESLEHVGRDEHGHVSVGKVDFARIVAAMADREYQRRTGRKKKITALRLGYESRCAPPHAFDVILGSQLGIGAYRALIEEHLDGHLVSVEGQFELKFVPFKKLVDPETLRTEVRYIQPGSDFHRLARFLESRTEVVDE